MLRNLLLGGTSPLFYRSPDDETGAGDPDPNLETPNPDAAEVAAAAEAEAAAIAAAEAAKPKPPQKDWRDREIGKKHAQIKERDTQLEAARAREAEITAENERLRGLVEAANRRTPPADGTTPPPVEIAPARPAAPARANDDDRIRAAAATMFAQQTAEQQMDAAVAKGKEQHGPKWDAAIDNLRTLGGFDQDTLVGILATDDPAKVLFELGAAPPDGGEPAYLRVMALPPAKRLNELAKIAMKEAPAAPKKKEISEASAPIEPIVQGGTAVREKPIDLYDQKFTEPPDGRTWPDGMKGDSSDKDAQWYAMREAQKKASKGRPWSPRA